MSERIYIYIAIVHHKHGSDVYAHRSQENAMAAVADYCRQWWGRECPGTPMPGGDGEIISDYFASVPDEYFDIEECYLND